MSCREDPGHDTLAVIESECIERYRLPGSELGPGRRTFDNTISNIGRYMAPPSTPSTSSSSPSPATARRSSAETCLDNPVYLEPNLRLTHNIFMIYTHSFAFSTHEPEAKRYQISQANTPGRQKRTTINQNSQFLRNFKSSNYKTADLKIFSRVHFCRQIFFGGFMRWKPSRRIDVLFFKGVTVCDIHNFCNCLLRIQKSVRFLECVTGIG